MHILLHALSLLVLVQCITVMNINYMAFQVQNTGLNARTEQFITAKISCNALKQERRTHSVCYVSAVHICENIRLRIKTVD